MDPASLAANENTTEQHAPDMSTQSVLRKSESVVHRRVAGEVIFVPIRQHVTDLQCIYATNDVGARAWELLDGQRSVGDIVAQICEEYSVGPQEAEADLAGFFAKLVETGCALAE